MPYEANYYMSPNGKITTNYDEIPCGHCIGCRLDYSRRWADRIMLEMKYHEKSYFVTLTYNDSNVPVIYVGDNDKDVRLTLDKRDVQLFIKRLRKYQNEKIRYYLSGEYGEETFRPHYHAIIFGLLIDDLKFYKNNERGDKLYISETLIKIWGKGLVIVGEATWETAAYTARYVVGKQTGNAEMKYYLGIEPPFSLMSRNPGIGKKYYSDNPDILQREKIFISTKDGGHEISIPRYFKKLAEKDPIGAAAVENLKEKHKQIAKNRNKIKQSLTNLDYLDTLKLEEKTKKQKTKILNRKKIK